MTGRTRSPSYPSTPIEQAIEYIKRLHQIERTNSIDREVAAKALGYTGISGRSATVLSDLSQYGLLEKAGKSEVRVTQLAVELLHPDDDLSWEGALHEAAQRPDLFQRVAERFPDGRPSDAALESFLIKQGFTYAAIPAALRAYRETFSYLENAIESERSSLGQRQVTDSAPDQGLAQALPMNRPLLPAPPRSAPTPAPGNSTVVVAAAGPDVRLVNKQIHLGGVLTNQDDADDLIATITALRGMLKPAPVEKEPAVTEHQEQPEA